jgi:hypothetical protein
MYTNLRTPSLHLLTIPRRNQKRQLATTVARLLNAQRQIIETVHDQLRCAVWDCNKVCA